MKLLYWISFIPLWPFYVVGILCAGLAFLCEMAAGLIHDETTYRIWLVLHKRECDKIFNRQNP